jgi:hypothetical protein
MRFYHLTLDDLQFKTYELFIFIISHFIFFGLLSTETKESETMDGGGEHYCTTVCARNTTLYPCCHHNPIYVFLLLIFYMLKLRLADY